MNENRKQIIKLNEKIVRVHDYTHKTNNNELIANTVGVKSISVQNSRGITLIALIITIILMLILAGVTINIAINGGLFDVAKNAVKQTEIEAYREKIDAIRISLLPEQTTEGLGGKEYIDKYEDETRKHSNFEESTITRKDELTLTIITKEGYEFEITEEETKYIGKAEGENPPVIDTSLYENAPKDENGILKANAKYIVDGEIAIVPKGFKIIEGIEGTKSIADGLVIQDKDGNEFVWIPVEVTANDTETRIVSFYRSNWVGNKREASLADNKTYTEPYVNGYSGEDTEYEEMLKSVYKNGGFYIGRYEAGSTDEVGNKVERTNKANGTTKMVVKKDQLVYNWVGWGASTNDWESDVVDSSGNNQGKGAVYLSKKMYEGKDVGVTSTLCYGVEWDAVLDFIKDKNDVSNSTSWGNYSDKGKILTKTGSSDTYSAKNIYDVAGNVWEWTMESSSGERRVRRGGGCWATGSESPAAQRGSFATITNSTDFGFRVALYIK